MSSSVKLISALLAAGAAGVAAGLARSQYERDCLSVEETEIVSQKIKKPRTVVFLSDLHDKEFGEGNERLFEALRAIKPDLVLIGGDTMVAKAGKAELEVTARLLDGLCGLFAGTAGTADSGAAADMTPDAGATGTGRAAGAGAEQDCRIFYGNGNHEQRMRREADNYAGRYQEFLELLRARHIGYLSDRTVQVGGDLSISGLDIDQIYYRDLAPSRMDKDYLEQHLGEADRGRFQILLAHSPLFFDAYADWGADLSLAGHFHGGTIRIPGLGGVMTPQYQFFSPLCAGAFERGESHMIVSRGLGTHSINIRIFNKPQVVVVRLKPGNLENVQGA